MSTIKVTISHKDYEKIKEEFAELRKKHGLRYVFNKSTESDEVLHHEWQGINDILKADYIVDREVVVDGKSKAIKEARIEYTFNSDSKLMPELYVLLNKITTARIEGKLITDDIEQLVEIFLYSVGVDPKTKKRFINYDYSKDFIEKTVKLIREGKYRGGKRCLID